MERRIQKIPAYGLFMTVTEQCWVMNYSVWLSRERKAKAHCEAGLPNYLLSPVTITTWRFDIPKLIWTQSSPMAHSGIHGASVSLLPRVKCRFSVIDSFLLPQGQWYTCFEEKHSCYIQGGFVTKIGLLCSQVGKTTHLSYRAAKTGSRQ